MHAPTLATNPAETKPKQRRLTGVLVPVSLALLVSGFIAPALMHAIEVWSTDEEFTYGYLIVPVAVLLVWWRRDAVRRAIGRGSNAGLLVIGLAIVLTLLGRRLEIHVLGGLAVSPFLLGTVAYLWGWQTSRVLLFPIGFLEFGLALYRGLLNSLGFALQELTATGAAWLGHLVGLAVVQQGLILQSHSFAFIVAQTCSGMSSLLSLLALVALWMYATRGPVKAWLVVLLSVLPLVVLANTLRVTLVLAVATWLGQDAALGFFHGASSLVLFGLALSGLMMVSRILGCKLAISY